jgi:outer membrane protein OmpA-like peptidoglycan-associated protein
MAKLRLELACDESWENMQRVPGGRHCERCDKRVVDFRRMTEREALLVASLFRPGELCGRLPRVRDGVPQFRAQPSRRSLMPAMLVTAAIAAGCSAPVVATADPVKSAPAKANLDTDGDGILDGNDKCPSEAEDRDGFEDDDGCPDPDNDRDRIADAVDKCPNEPETYNGYQDEDGCPDKGGLIIADAPVTILDVVTFDAGSDAIAAASQKLLDEIAATFKAHPELGTFVVKGHALATEKDAAKLAERRAKNVVAALVKRGVDKAVLDVRAIAPESPSAGETAAHVRRVDFEIAPKATCATPGAKPQ